MLYHFKDDVFDEACEIWKSEIMEHAKDQRGFVRMQFLAARPNAMALGTWQDKADARRFMETGVFKRLLAKLTNMTTASPEQMIWDLKYFEEK
jgi:hypothetical protein